MGDSGRLSGEVDPMVGGHVSSLEGGTDAETRPIRFNPVDACPAASWNCQHCHARSCEGTSSQLGTCQRHGSSAHFRQGSGTARVQ